MKRGYLAAALGLATALSVLPVDINAGEQPKYTSKALRLTPDGRIVQGRTANSEPYNGANSTPTSMPSRIPEEVVLPEHGFANAQPILNSQPENKPPVLVLPGGGHGDSADANGVPETRFAPIQRFDANSNYNYNLLERDGWKEIGYVHAGAIYLRLEPGSFNRRTNTRVLPRQETTYLIVQPYAGPLSETVVENLFESLDEQCGWLGNGGEMRSKTNNSCRITGLEYMATANGQPLTSRSRIKVYTRDVPRI